MDERAARDFNDALDYAERMLGSRLEPRLAEIAGEPTNAAEFKRIATVQTFGDAWPRDEHLDRRTRALVSVAVAGTREPLRGQIGIALHNGATKEEIVEVLIQLAAYAGVARAFEGYAIAAQVFSDSQEEHTA
jgi:4-carboxymuconolactone decarboxylase